MCSFLSSSSFLPFNGLNYQFWNPNWDFKKLSLKLTLGGKTCKFWTKVSHESGWWSNEDFHPVLDFHFEHPRWNVSAQSTKHRKIAKTTRSHFKQFSHFWAQKRRFNSSFLLTAFNPNFALGWGRQDWSLEIGFLKKVLFIQKCLKKGIFLTYSSKKNVSKRICSSNIFNIFNISITHHRI